MQYVLILTWKQLVPSRPPLLTLNTNKTSSAHSKLPSLLLLCLFLNPFAGSDLKNMSTTSYSLCYCHYSWTYTEQLCNVDSVDCWAVWQYLFPHLSSLWLTSLVYHLAAEAGRPHPSASPHLPSFPFPSIPFLYPSLFLSRVPFPFPCPLPYFSLPPCLSPASGSGGR